MLKPLNPLDFSLILIEDMGMLYITVKTKERKRYAKFKCNLCNKIVLMPVASAKKAKKCNSCSNSYAATTHGKTGTALYIIWKNMKQRCTYKKHPQYADYMGRGITICDAWLNSYETFENWAVISGYTQQLTLDRIDNNDGYFPENCRFTTRTVQARNKRKLMATNSSGYRGIGRISNSTKFYARISVEGKKIHLGSFLTKEQAAQAYDAYVIKHKLEHTINA